MTAYMLRYVGMSPTKETIALPVLRWDHSDTCHITFQTIVGVRPMVGSVTFSVLTVIMDHFSPNYQAHIYILPHYRPQ